MSDLKLDTAAQVVLSQFDLSCSALRPLGNRGGFSGATLWRMKGPNGDLCLRAWPPGEMSRERILEIHSLMKLARDQGLRFVPAVLITRSGSTWVLQADRFWELTAWMPGAATNPLQVTRPQVETAFAALALLHRAWAPAGQKNGPCPAVRRRLLALQGWEARIRTSCPKLDLHDPAQASAEQARRLLQGHAAKMPLKLTPWLDRELPLQPCLCDIWHDHVLFEGDFVTALVDYGGVKTDHVAVDLARLLGSLVEDRFDLRAAGLEAYTRIRPISLQEEELVSGLDQTGTLVGLITWLKWLYFEDKQFDNRAAAARRLQALVERVEQWES